MQIKQFPHISSLSSFPPLLPSLLLPPLLSPSHLHFGVHNKSTLYERFILFLLFYNSSLIWKFWFQAKNIIILFGLGFLFHLWHLFHSLAICCLSHMFQTFSLLGFILLFFWFAYYRIFVFVSLFFGWFEKQNFRERCGGWRNKNGKQNLCKRCERWRRSWGKNLKCEEYEFRGIMGKKY